MDHCPDCFHALTPEQLAAVPVQSPEEIREMLRRAREKLRRAAAAPKPSPRGSLRYR